MWCVALVVLRSIVPGSARVGISVTSVLQESVARRGTRSLAGPVMLKKRGRIIHLGGTRPDTSLVSCWSFADEDLVSLCSVEGWSARSPGGEFCGVCQGMQISQYIGCSKAVEHAKTFEALT